MINELNTSSKSVMEAITVESFQVQLPMFVIENCWMMKNCSNTFLDAYNDTDGKYKNKCFYNVLTISENWLTTKCSAVRICGVDLNKVTKMRYGPNPNSKGTEYRLFSI